MFLDSYAGRYISPDHLVVHIERFLYKSVNITWAETCLHLLLR
jgi:hypothetical protein